MWVYEQFGKFHFPQFCKHELYKWTMFRPSLIQSWSWFFNLIWVVWRDCNVAATTLKDNDLMLKIWKFLSRTTYKTKWKYSWMECSTCYGIWFTMTISLQISRGCLLKSLRRPFLNNFSHMWFQAVGTLIQSLLQIC